MTTTQLTQEEKRIKIAEACGFKPTPKFTINGLPIYERDGKLFALKVAPIDKAEWLPDYFGSLEDCHEMEKQAPMGYGDEVRAMVARDAGVAPQHICDQYVICATAEQRAEAFGRIMHLWP